MERLHTRLYEKYRNLKKRRLSEASECNAKVQGEFEKYLTAVESMIEDLKSENNELHQKISSLEDSQAEYQQNLMEEHRKVEELANEVERLRSVACAEGHQNIRSQGDEFLTLATPLNVCADGILETTDTRVESLPAHPSASSPNTTAASPLHDSNEDNPTPDCSVRKTSKSGDPTENDNAMSIYQMLIESLVGMKFSVEKQADNTHLSFTHQSSGYSFTLTWLREGDDDEGELLYRVSSLGTIENVAVDWMKEELLFTLSMCHSFFGRISKVLGRYA
ncbi:titan9 [Wolffia australiana]